MAMIENTFGFSSCGRARLRNSLMTRLSVWRSRRALAKLDARALEDIGVSPQEARREAKLAAWDVPHTWVSK